MKRIGCCIIVFVSVARGVSAQQLVTRDATWSTWSMWYAGVGYPQAAAGGLSVVLGKETSSNTPGRGRFIRGIQGTVNAGLGETSARIGWSDMFACDAGISGWSYEAVYLRPWLLRWGLEPATYYVGAGITRYVGYIRLSGAILVNPSTSRVAPALSAGVVFNNR